MIYKPLLILTIFIFIFFNAKAISFASAASTYHVPVDSASGVAPFSANTSTENKSISFFTKMKNKVVGSLAQFFLRKQQKDGAKKAFGLASLALILLSVFALFVGYGHGIVSGPVVVILFLAGILAGLISLFIKKDSSKKNSGNRLGLIGLILGAVLIIALAIAFSGKRH
jgi:uncharacterized membrane protein